MGIGNKHRIIVILPLLAVCVALLAVCTGALYNFGAAKLDPYYIIGSKENQEQLRDLFALLADEDDSAENTFAVVREIANNFAKAQEYSRLIHFLENRTVNYPDDPYNTYYLLMIAYAYLQQDSLPVAMRYFDLIVKNYPDLTVSGGSIHLACLNQLIDLTDNWKQRVWYYQELISRFSDSIDIGAAWFMLGQTYEHIGDWGSAIQAYTRYLPYASSIIHGFPYAHDYARQQVDFNNSSKDWTYESLPALLSAVTTALGEGDPRRLNRLQAKVNFFAHSWEQGGTDRSRRRGEADDSRISRVADFDLSIFMRGSQIRWADSVDPSSNATEAFLRTSGWSQSIAIWYLYFRKIYFPSDPEIHGRWEWAGVYYGEKL